MGASISGTEVSGRTDSEPCPGRRLSHGGVRTVGAQEMDFTGLNETAIGGVFSLERRSTNQAAMSERCLAWVLRSCAVNVLLMITSVLNGLHNFCWSGVPNRPTALLSVLDCQWGRVRECIWHVQFLTGGYEETAPD